MTTAGYREISHTADWALQVWAPDLSGLLVQAARGMTALLDLQLAEAPRLEHLLTLDAADPESLRAKWTDADGRAELIAQLEQRGIEFATLAQLAGKPDVPHPPRRGQRHLPAGCNG